MLHHFLKYGSREKVTFCILSIFCNHFFFCHLNFKVPPFDGNLALKSIHLLFMYAYSVNRTFVKSGHKLNGLSRENFLALLKWVFTSRVLFKFSLNIVVKQFHKHGCDMHGIRCGPQDISLGMKKRVTFLCPVLFPNT